MEARDTPSQSKTWWVRLDWTFARMCWRITQSSCSRRCSIDSFSWLSSTIDPCRCTTFEHMVKCLSTLRRQQNRRPSSPHHYAFLWRIQRNHPSIAQARITSDLFFALLKRTEELCQIIPIERLLLETDFALPARPAASSECRRVP